MNKKRKNYLKWSEGGREGESVNERRKWLNTWEEGGGTLVSFKPNDESMQNAKKPKKL